MERDHSLSFLINSLGGTMKSFNTYIKEAGISPGVSNPNDRSRISNDELDKNSEAAGETPQSYVKKTIDSKLDSLPDGDFDKNHIDPPKGSDDIPSKHIRPDEIKNNPPNPPKGRFAP